ncbi:MAG: hypothetical protein LUC93_16495 [Planctomycetaceae bacterium]|nr:hypothetical protein [Planctomycetaceae bacterium]
MAYRVPRRVDKLKSLGNTVVPLLVMQIGLAIMAAEGDAVQAVGGEES